VLPESLYFVGGSPPAAYAALTAGSKLQRLDIRYCTLPAGAWQHIFPAGRQLLHLQMLDLGGVLELSGELAATWHLHSAAPDLRLITSCCPGLRDLCMHSAHLPAERLTPLTGLQHLTLLALSIGIESGQEVMGSSTS
jgi:hypothetical protein